MESPTPSRRDVLRTLGAAATLPALSTVAAAQSAPDDYGPLGEVAVPGTTEAVVSGDVAYLATTDGFATVDVADPEDPTVLARETDILADREDGPLRMVWDAKVEGDRLLVGGPANGLQGAVNALVLYDVSDPASPEQVAVHETEAANHNVFLADGLAYYPANYAEGASSANPLVIVDVEAGEELGRWSPLDADEAWGDVFTGLRPLHDMYVQEGTAYLAYWDAGTWLLDVSDPASPSVVGHVRGRPPEELAALSDNEARREAIRPPGNDHYVAVDDDASVLGVGVESWAVDGEGGPGGIALYDLSDPSDPSELAEITPPPTDDPSRGGVWTTSHNFELTSDRLYASWYRGGVQVFDVSDPGAPGLLREWANRDRMSFWTAQALAPGETFVGAAENHRGNDEQFAGLVTFPDAPLDERSTRTQTPAATATDDGAAGSNRSTTAADAPNASSPTDAAPRTDAATGTTEDSSGAGPGFGVAAAVAGSGLAAWRLLRRRDGAE